MVNRLTQIFLFGLGVLTFYACRAEPRDIIGVYYLPAAQIEHFRRHYVSDYVKMRDGYIPHEELEMIRRYVDEQVRYFKIVFLTNRRVVFTGRRMRYKGEYRLIGNQVLVRRKYTQDFIPQFITLHEGRVLIGLKSIYLPFQTEFHKSTEAVNINWLLKALSIADEKEKVKIIHQLADYEFHESITPLKTIVRDGYQTMPVRSAAVFALGEIDGTDTADFILETLRNVKNPHLLRIEAVKSIEKRHIQKAVPDLLALLNDETQKDVLRAQCAHTLLAFKNKEALPVLKDMIFSDSVTLQLVGLSSLTSHTVEISAPLLIQKLDFSPPVVQKKAYDLLKQLTGKDFGMYYYRWLCWARYEGFRVNEKNVTALLISLKSADVSERKFAARQLRDRKDKEVISALLGALTDKNKVVRMYAAWALEDRDDPRVVDPLCAVLDDSSLAVREFAICALVHYPAHQKYMPKIIKAYGVENRRLRRIIAYQLRFVKSQTAKKLLDRALTDGDRAVRLNAAMSLRYHGGPLPRIATEQLR